MVVYAADTDLRHTTNHVEEKEIETMMRGTLVSNGLTEIRVTSVCLDLARLLPELLHRR